GLSSLLHALFWRRWLHILPLPGGGYPVRTRAFPFHASVACVGAKAVLEFSLFEILRLFCTEFGRDERGLGARRITGSISADAATQGIGMNRAFSAGIGIALIPGALPQAKMNTAPLALNRYMASAGMMILRRLRHVSQRKNRPPEETRGRFPR